MKEIDLLVNAFSCYWNIQSQYSRSQRKILNNLLIIYIYMKEFTYKYIVLLKKDLSDSVTTLTIKLFYLQTQNS